MLRVLCYFVVVAAVYFGAGGIAFGATLVEPTTGLEVEAPAGFKLSITDQGAYIIKKKKLQAQLIIGRSPLDLNATADDFIANSGIKVTKDKRSGDTVSLKGKLGKKKLEVVLRKVGDEIEVATFSGQSKNNKKTKKNKKKKKKKKSKKRSSLRLSARDIVILNRIIQTRRGGNVIPLPVNLPTVRFTAPDGGSTAIVPNLPGWRFSGADGIISGGHPTQGIVNLGIPVLVSLPSNIFANGVINNLVPPDQAIAQVWPKHASLFLGTQIQVLNVQTIAGTDGWLGAGFVSAMHAVTFVFNGITWQSIFLSGVSPVDVGLGAYLWYHSYIAVPLNSPQGIGAALMNTWATWDNTVANIQRLEQILNNIPTIQGGSPIDPVVFDRIHQKWVDYIRG